MSQTSNFTVSGEIKDANVVVAAIPSQIFTEALTENNRQQVNLAEGATDVALPLGPIAAAKVLMIVSDLPITLKVNGSIVALLCKMYALSGCAVTSITASNGNGTEAHVTVLAGA